MAGEVLRVGHTVRRRAGPWTPAVHELLRHLEQVDFQGAPRALGMDRHDREILSFIPGDVVHPRMLDDADLARVARLIRDYHAAVASFMPSAVAHWQTDGRDPTVADELVCHNDLAPRNLIVGEQSWASIDWDLVAPGRCLWDLAPPVCNFVPLWPEQPAGIRRYRVSCEAYGLARADERELLKRCARAYETHVAHVGRQCGPRAVRGSGTRGPRRQLAAPFQSSLPPAMPTGAVRRKH